MKNNKKKEAPSPKTNLKPYSNSVSRMQKEQKNLYETLIKPMKSKTAH